MIATILLATAILTLFFFVPPETPYMPFLFILLAGTLAFSIFRRLSVGAAVAVFLFLGYFGMANWLNLLLIIAIAAILEYYFSSR